MLPPAEVVIADAVDRWAAAPGGRRSRALPACPDFGLPHSSALSQPDRPWVASDPTRTYLAAGLDTSGGHWPRYVRRHRLRLRCHPHPQNLHGEPKCLSAKHPAQVAMAMPTRRRR